MDWDTDERGNIVTRPLMGWETVAAAGTACILRVRYAERPEQLKTEDASRLALVMSPAKALELADDLRRMAERILAQKPPTDRPPN